MRLVSKIKLSAVLAILVLGFQNCGSKNDFATESGEDNKDEIQKTIKDGDNKDVSTAGEFEVVSYSESQCQKQDCSVDFLTFKSKQTISFKNGKISGRAACNGYGGDYKLTVRPNEGTSLIKIENVLSTMMACQHLDEEQILFSALSDAYKITDLDKDSVELYASINDKNNSRIGTLSLRRKKSVVAPPPAKISIVGKYKAISVSQSLCRADMKYDLAGPCVIQSVKFKSDQRVRFAANGSISGSAACNDFGGKYVHTKREKEGTDLLTISGVVATRMGCDLLKEEDTLFRAFASAYKVTVSKDKAVIYLKEGTLLLHRVK
jgi:heat shock protein HslJ